MRLGTPSGWFLREVKWKPLLSCVFLPKPKQTDVDIYVAALLGQRIDLKNIVRAATVRRGEVARREYRPAGREG